MDIAFDFDGTVARDSWPDIGKAKVNWPVVRWLKRRKALGDRLILWTCRENYGGIRYPDSPYLDDAVEFCRKLGIEPDSVNMSIGEKPGDYGTKYGRKVTAKFYLDDGSVPFRPDSVLAPVFWRLFLKFVDIRIGRNG